MAIQSLQTVISNISEAKEVQLTDQVVATYDLERWAEHFSLMTAGYRDHMDPDDPGSPHVPFNVVTVAIMVEAKARVLRRKIQNGSPGDVHIGGEVRANTQIYIQTAARVYAAHGFSVHLRHEVPTSPIWYSSFGIFYEEYQSGDNFTASHSPYFKLGWKVLDSEGKELTEEEDDIIQEVRQIVAERASIRLAPWHSGNRIQFDFDVDEAYAEYQRSTLGSEVFASINAAVDRGFRCAACPLGGSMGASSRRIFKHLGIPEHAVYYFLDDEDSRFHRVGEINNHNFGADVGKSEVCANTGAPEKLLAGDADLILLWDPDGDRLNVMTIAPASYHSKALEFGLKVGNIDGQRMVVYLTPNQLYLLLVEYRLTLLGRLGLLQKYDWFIGTTFPTSMAIEELAAQSGLPTIRVPVGFRNLGDLCRAVEKHLGVEHNFTTTTGQCIPIGAKARALILCEESGGAALGGPELMHSRKNKSILALREKDGMQLSLMAWSLAASLHESGLSMAEKYGNIISQRNIQYRYSARLDVSLYDETLIDYALQTAKKTGILRRDRLEAFFRDATVDFSEQRRSKSDVRKHLIQASEAMVELPTINQAAWIGDGSMFEMDGARLIVRASGTDALIRYYIEATSDEKLRLLKQFVGGLRL